MATWDDIVRIAQQSAIKPGGIITSTAADPLIRGSSWFDDYKRLRQQLETPETSVSSTMSQAVPLTGALSSPLQQGRGGRDVSTGGGVYTEGRLGDMTQAQIQRAYSNLLGQPTGVVKPGAPDPRFGKSVSQMQDALRGQPITSTGNLMNDFGLWGKSMVRNWPSRLIGKGVMAIGENFGLGQQASDTFDPNSIDRFERRDFEDQEVTSPKEPASPMETVFDQQALAKTGVADWTEREFEKKQREANRQASVQRGYDRMSDVARGIATASGVGGPRRGRRQTEYAQGGLMSLAEGGRPIYPLELEHEHHKNFIEEMRKKLEKLRRDIGKKKKAQGGRIGFADGSDEENEFSIFSPSTWFEEEETPNTSLYGEPETIIFNEKSYTIPSQVFPTQGYDLISGEALQRYIEENKNLKNFYRENPDMIPDEYLNKAQGGRIGFGEGGDSYAIPVTPPGLGPEDFDTAKDYWGDAWDPNYADILTSAWENMSGKSDPSMSSGGRIGYARGRVVHPGGYAGDEEKPDHSDIPWWYILQDIDLDDPEFAPKAMEEYKKWIYRNQKASGGRIGLDEGGHMGPVTGVGIDSLGDYLYQFLNRFYPLTSDTAIDVTTGRLVNEFEFPGSLTGSAGIVLNEDDYDPEISLKKIIGEDSSASVYARPDKEQFGIRFSTAFAGGGLATL